MTTTEHIEKIKQKCLANLALAEKRTPGRWHICFRGNIRNEAGEWLAEIESCDRDKQGNAAYIAACAGAAEAGWRSTIAAIEFLLERTEMYSTTMAQELIAAWPEELL